MRPIKTPGVYIVEKSAFPNSVVEVATAVPAFIGYTEKASNTGTTLIKKPWRIGSMAEYHSHFGGAPQPVFTVKKADGDIPNFELEDQYTGRYLLYYGMLQFFQNGGGPCYIVSVGNYESPVTAKDLTGGISTLINEQEPTIVVTPDAVLLEEGECIEVQQAALQHCGSTMRSRVAILDVWGGYKNRHDPPTDCVADFRNHLGTDNLDFGAAYYPWVHCSIIVASDLGHENIGNPDVLKALLAADIGPAETEVRGERRVDPKKAEQLQEIDQIGSTDGAVDQALLNKSLVAISPMFRDVLDNIKDRLNLLPPSAALAGIYTMVDNTRGVWKAPANVSLSGVVSPAVKITHEEQEDLNVTAQGKSINAIRDFIGEGTLVWGARTLDGNSLDWRYINVRRTMIMLEQSIKLAGKAFAFEKNDANTWVTMKRMIDNFLTGIWKRGGLAGASPDDAFSVRVGLGETMTPEDILEGILRVSVLVAVSRPAEFIEIEFEQQMQNC